MILSQIITSYYKFRTLHFNLMFPIISKIYFKFSLTRIRYQNLTKFAYAVTYYADTILQFMTCMESFHIMPFL